MGIEAPQLGKIDLTSTANSHKLREGVVFMANEAGGENPAARHVNPDASPAKPIGRGTVAREALRIRIFHKQVKGSVGGDVSLEQQAISRRAWQEFYGGKARLPGEQQVVEEIIRRGGMPGGTGGGHEEQPPTPSAGSGGERGNRPPDAPAGHDNSGEVPPPPVEDENPAATGPENWGDDQRQRYEERFYWEQYTKNQEEFEKQFRKISPYSTEGVDQALIRFICKAPDPKLLYSFVNTIAALPLETELVDYDLGLYAGTNMSVIISELRPTLGNESPWLKKYGAQMKEIVERLDLPRGTETEQQKERFDTVTKRVEAFRLMHQVNKDIITDATDAFVNAAAIIAPSHLQTLLDINGVSVVMRLFEPNYQSLLTGREGRVTGENEAEMLGKEPTRNELSAAMAGIGRTGKIGSIEEQLRDLVKEAKGDPEQGLAPNPYLSELADMQDWEIRLAADAAKILENLTLRSIEHISQNSINEKSRLQGFGKERAARLFSLILEVKRFTSGEETGGMEYFNGVLDWYQKLREKHGYGTTHITKLFGGKDIGDYEAQGLLRSGSMFASWRGRGTIIEQAPMVVGKKLTSIGKYIDDAIDKRRDEILQELGKPALRGVWEQIEKQLKEAGYKTGDVATEGEAEAFEKERDIRFKARFMEITGGGDAKFKRFNREFERRKADAQPKLLREIFLDERGELRGQFTNAYGPLYKIDDITPKETDFQVPGLLEAKAAVRAAIWRKMADENPMALAFLMSGMDFDGKGEFFTGAALEEFRLFARRLKPNEPDPSTDTSAPKKYTYRELLTKLNRANEIRLASVNQNTLSVSRAEKIDRLRAALKQAREEHRTADDIQRLEAEIAAIKPVALPKLLKLDDILFRETGNQSNLKPEGFQVSLTKEEAALLDQIRSYGKAVAQELTTVRFPYIPIMNDITWGTVEFSKAGAIYYSRQIGDDVSRFNAWKKIEPFQRNPAKFDPNTQVVEIFEQAKELLTGPNGTGGSQDILLPFELSHWDMIQIGGQFGNWRGSGLVKFFAQNLFVREAAHNANLSNSRAQVWGGVDAPAFDIVAMNDLFNIYLKHALVRRGNRIKGPDGRNKYSDIYDFVRKKKGITLKFGIPAWLLAIIGDLLPIAVLGGGNEGRKKVTERQQQ